MCDLESHISSLSKLEKMYRQAVNAMNGSKRYGVKKLIEPFWIYLYVENYMSVYKVESFLSGIVL